MTFRIAPIAEEHIEGFRAGLDSVARERRYLLYLEAPPPEDVSKFLRNNIRNGYPQYVALVGDRVVGWCDVLPIDRPTRAHNGVLGLAVAGGVPRPRHRHRSAERSLARCPRFRLHARRARLSRGQCPRRRALREFGFCAEGVQRKAVRVDGVYEDLICMALLHDQA